MADVLPAVTTGNRLQALQALRDTLAARIDDSESARDVAALSGQLTAVLKQIDEIAYATSKTSKADEVAAKRRERRKPIRDGKARSG